MKKYFLLFTLFLISIELQAQIRMSIFAHGGITRPSSNFSFVGEKHPQIVNKNLPVAAYGLGVRLYHQEGWFSSYSISNFGTVVGTRVKDTELFAPELKSYTIVARHWNATVTVGKEYILKEKEWSAAWMSGINVVFINKLKSSRGGIDYNTTGINNSNASDIPISIKEGDREVKRHSTPSLQLSGRVTRYIDDGRSSFSLKLLLNTGLQYYRTQNMTVHFGNETYNTFNKSKGDFFALLLQYDVYLGKK